MFVSTPLGKLFDKYVEMMGFEKMGLTADSFQFICDNGSIDRMRRCIIGPNDTADTVGFEDQDIITAVPTISPTIPAPRTSTCGAT